MKLEVITHDNLRIVTVPEARIDAAAAIRFKEAMRTATADGPDHVVLDLSQVRFVDSSGLGAIVAAMKAMGAGRRLDLAGLTPDVAKVFRLTRMDTVFVIHDAADAAARRASG
jgi:anti-sigma B factor antagonist